MTTTTDFTRIKNDINGNPRYVCHYSHLNTEVEKTDNPISATPIFKVNDSLDNRYKLAVNRAKMLGGRKYHNKQFGGGVVFQSYNLQDLCNKINNLLS